MSAPPEMQPFVGKTVSIECNKDLGTFQGVIRSIEADNITIWRAFRNGFPVRTLDTELNIKISDIADLRLIAAIAEPAAVAPAAQQQQTRSKNRTTSNRTAAAAAAANNGSAMVAMMMNDLSLQNGGGRIPPPQLNNNQQSAAIHSNSSPVAHHPNLQVQAQFGNLIPTKVEVRMGAASVPYLSQLQQQQQQQLQQQQPALGVLQSTSNSGFSANQQRTASNRKTAAYVRNQAFGQTADDPLLLNEEFDFESNLALFDKRAIWDEIDANQQQCPASARQLAAARPKNYRHDENILPSLPMPAGSADAQQPQQQPESRATNGARQRTEVTEFSTDDGLVVATVSLQQRLAVQTAAVVAGLVWPRQCDMLARGCAELALQLLGGARRLTPQNQHQWPTIVVVIDPQNAAAVARGRASAGAGVPGADDVWQQPAAETGFATGRHLASHGLKVCVYGGGASGGGGTELELLRACGENAWMTGDVKKLPSCDLVILAVKRVMRPSITKWINDSRSPVLAIDPSAVVPPANPSAPPPVSIKHAILPVLPVHGIATAVGASAKLYLCNLGIPQRFYADAGLQYRSPFGHKFVIPLHPIQRAGSGTGIGGQQTESSSV